MPVDLSTYEKLKKAVETAKDAKSRAQGSLETTLKRLKAEHGVSTGEEVDKLVAELTEKRDRLEEAFKKDLEEFEKEWGDVLK